MKKKWSFIDYFDLNFYFLLTLLATEQSHCKGTGWWLNSPAPFLKCLNITVALGCTLNFFWERCKNPLLMHLHPSGGEHECSKAAEATSIVNMSLNAAQNKSKWHHLKTLVTMAALSPLAPPIVGSTSAIAVSNGGKLLCRWSNVVH